MSTAKATSSRAEAAQAPDSGLSTAQQRLTPPQRGPVIDADPVRAELTTRLLSTLAAHLGFRLSDAKVQVDAEAAGRTGPRGARGLMADGVIYLHPDRYDPTRSTGRALLAHEATHLAQRAGAGRGDVRSAEAEAARAAVDFAEGRVVAPPVVGLPDSAYAADAGAPAATLPAAGVPAPAAREVRQSHAADVRAIQTRLETGFIEAISEGPPFASISAADVSYVLTILDQYPLDTARAMMREVGTPYRARLAENLEPGHRRRHRQSVLACYGAMTATEHQRLGPNLFDGMALSGLGARERLLVQGVLRNLSDNTVLEVSRVRPEGGVTREGLLAGDLRASILAIMQSPVTEQELEDQRREEARAAAQAADPVRVPVQRVPEARLSEIRARLRSPSAPDARTTLRLLAELLPAAPATLAQGAPTSHPRSEQLASVVAELEQGGAIRRLIDAVPESQRLETHETGAVLLEVIRHRPAAANLAHVQELLSYGLFDWAIRDWEAWLAYQIVRRLPPADQERWRRLDNGRWFRRLEENIPNDRIASGEYQGVVLERDERGRLVDVASRIADTLAHPEVRQIWDRILAACREGINEATAPRLLIDIFATGDPARPAPATAPAAGRPQPTAERREERPSPEDIRRAAVVRLDQLGYLDEIFADLPDSFLFQIDNLDLVRRIAALRDPEQLRRQVYALISRNWWRNIPVFGFLFSEWSVSAHEAFVAFQLARLLPAGDRAELEATGHWSAMVDAMTVEMRHASGMHLYADRTGTERDRLRDRLRDDRLWHPDRAAELRTLVRMAIELGDRRFVFDRSARVRPRDGWAAGLQPMVDQFELYDPPARPTYQPERLPIRQAPEDLWGIIRNAAGWLWTKLSAVGELLGSLRLRRTAVGFEDLDLNVLQRGAGGGLGPAILSDRPGSERRPSGPEPAAWAPGGPPPNRLTVLYNPRNGVFWLELPELAITSVNQISAGLEIRTNRITIRGLRVWATFPAQRLDQPVAARLHLPEAEIVDLLMTGDDLFTGISRIALRQLWLHLSRTGVEAPIPQPPGSDYSLPIPIIGPIIAFVVNLIRLAGYLGRSGRSVAQLQSAQATVESIELEGIAHGAGITARSARVEGILLGAGLNRGAYLRGLRQVVQRRRAREAGRPVPDPARVADFDRQIVQIDAELAGIAARERRMGELHAKYVQDPSSLTPREREEAARLERELAGGAYVDIGRLQVEGLSGDLQAQRVSLAGLSGDVASPVFTPETAPLSSVFVSDAERIAAFRRSGAQYPGGATRPAELQVRAEEATALGLMYLGDIPTADSLRRELDRLPPGTPPERRTRLEGLIPRVARYEELERRRRGQDPTPLSDPERATLVRERDELRRIFGLQVASVAAQGVGADLLFGPGLSDVVLRGGVVEDLTARGVEYGGFFRAETLTGRRLTGAPIRGLAQPTGAGERSGYTFGAEELRAQGVILDWAGNRAAEVGITGLSGELEMHRAERGGQATGYRIRNLSARTATVAGIDYRTSSVWVHSEGTTTITGISLDAEMDRRPVGWIVRIPRLHLDRVSADRLIAENNGGTTPWRAEVTSGSLLNIDIRDYVFPIGAPEPRAGEPTPPTPLPRRFELGGLDQLRFNVALGALGSGSGVLSSVTETGAPRTTGMLVVQTAGDTATDGQQIDLNGLVLTEGLVQTPSGLVRVRRLELGASVHHSGDTWTIRSLSIPVLELGRVRWRTADGAEITSTGGARLSGLRAHGSVTTPAGGPIRVHVDELRIDSITAQHLRYHQDPIDITIQPGGASTIPGAPPASGRSPLRIEDIRLRDFDWTSDVGPTAGTLTVASTAVEFQGQIAQHLSTAAAVNLTSFHANFTSGGHVVLRARGSLDAGLSYEEPDPAGGPPVRTGTAHVGVAGLDTGVVDIGPGAIQFGSPTQPGLEIRDITVDRINFRSRRPDLVVESLTGGRGVVIHRPRAKFRIELRNARERAAAGGRDASAIRRIVLHEIGIDAIELDGVRVTLNDLLSPATPGGPARPVQITLPAGEPGFLRGLALVLPPGGSEITPPASPTGSWTIPELHLAITGDTDPATDTRRSALLIPSIQASVAGILEDASARLETERIDVTLLSGGGVTVDLSRPSITAIEAVLRRSPAHRLRIAGLGPIERPEEGGVRAERVQFDSRTGQLTLTQLGLNRLRYFNEAAGIEVTVNRATLPGDVRTTLPGAGRTLSGTIPELNIEDAWFQVDFAARRRHAPPPGPATGRPTNWWTDLLTQLGPIEQVLDALQARIRLTVHQTATGIFRTDTPIDFTITNGRVDYHAVQAQVLGGWSFLAYFELDRGARELKLILDIPVELISPLWDWITPNEITIAYWNLPGSELRQAESAHLVRLWRLLNVQGRARDYLDRPSPPPTPTTTPPGPSPVELRNIIMDLAVRGTRPMPLDMGILSNGAITGTVTLGRNALTTLHLTGNLPGSISQGTSTLSQATIDAVDLTIPGVAGIRTGGITIHGVRDLFFSTDPGTFTPRLLNGAITRAMARNIEWRVP